MAIQNEDYDGAKVIKMEIDRLRDAVAPTNLLRRGQSYESEDKPI
jgi:centrosomal protein CEP104